MDNNELKDLLNETMMEIYGFTLPDERYEEIFEFVELRDEITKHEVGYQWLTDVMFAMMTVEQRQRIIQELKKEINNDKLD